MPAPRNIVSCIITAASEGKDTDTGHDVDMDVSIAPEVSYTEIEGTIAPDESGWYIHFNVQTLFLALTQPGLMVAWQLTSPV